MPHAINHSFSLFSEETEMVVGKYNFVDSWEHDLAVNFHPKMTKHLGKSMITEPTTESRWLELYIQFTVAVSI